MKSFLEKINKKLNAQGGFLKAVSVLVGGTAFAQGIAILALPILTRLYTPEEFALFGIYTSLLLTLSVASCLRFEIAIPIAESDSEAIHLVFLAVLSNFVISLLLSLIIWVFHSEIILLLKQPDFTSLIWLVPVGVFFVGLYSAVQYWATRKKQFPIIAKSRMVQSISGVSVQLVMGAIGFSALGLVVGQIIKVSAGVWQLVINFLHEASRVIRTTTFHQLKQVFKKNKQFPKYSALEALANSTAIQLPIVIIATISLDAEAGFLMLAMQIMAIPISFIGAAVSQVYLAHAPEKYSRGELTQYTYECILQLIKVGIIPLSIICFLAPTIVPFIFGEVWQRTGEMMLWMLPWFIMQFLVSPISMSLHITGYQKVALILQIFGLIIRVGGLYIFSIFMASCMFEYYALSGFIFYSIYLFIVFLVVKGSDKEFKRVDV
ncbi:oligosaccharide flippase family protein [Acinetobacter sp. YH12127]|uniref:lipopolysaccharide biosynthesis protein n=1 Tax=Acinetobacter sp. YH12127 TaxID=2601112 RepID=UPI0015D37408